MRKHIKNILYGCLFLTGIALEILMLDYIFGAVVASIYAITFIVGLALLVYEMHNSSYINDEEPSTNNQ